MESYSNRLPKTMENRGFPIGDVCFSEKIDAVDTWIADVEQYSDDHFRSYVVQASKPVNNRTSICDNYTASKDLCRHWDTLQGKEHRLPITGFLVTNAFINITRLLPFAERNMTYDLDIMRTKHPIHPREFGRFAWSGMQYSHPTVFAQYEKLLALSEKRFDLDHADNRDYYVAGMMLPYTLSVFSRLEGYIQQNELKGWSANP